MRQNKGNKTNCHKNTVVKVPHSMIAEVVDCSVSTVKAVRNDQRSNQTDLGQRVELAEILLEEGQNKLIQEVKRVVQFK